MHKGSCLCVAVNFTVKGAFDTPTNSKLAVHIFVADKGDYCDIADGSPQNQQ